MEPRFCQIVSASAEDIHERGDCEYGLIDFEGTPQGIGTAIAESLKSVDLYSGNRGMLVDECGGELFLTVRIKVMRKDRYERTEE